MKLRDDDHDDHECHDGLLRKMPKILRKDTVRKCTDTTIMLGNLYNAGWYTNTQENSFVPCNVTDTHSDYKSVQPKPNTKHTQHTTSLYRLPRNPKTNTKCKTSPPPLLHPTQLLAIQRNTL